MKLKHFKKLTKSARLSAWATLSEDEQNSLVREHDPFIEDIAYMDRLLFQASYYC